MKKFAALLLSFIMVFTLIPSIVGPAAKAEDPPTEPTGEFVFGTGTYVEDGLYKKSEIWNDQGTYWQFFWESADDVFVKEEIVNVVQTYLPDPTPTPEPTPIPTPEPTPTPTLKPDYTIDIIIQDEPCKLDVYGHQVVITFMGETETTVAGDPFLTQVPEYFDEHHYDHNYQNGTVSLSGNTALRDMARANYERIGGTTSSPGVKSYLPTAPPAHDPGDQNIYPEAKYFGEGWYFIGSDRYNSPYCGPNDPCIYNDIYRKISLVYNGVVVGDDDTPQRLLDVVASATWVFPVAGEMELFLNSMYSFMTITSGKPQILPGKKETLVGYVYQYKIVDINGDVFETERTMKYLNDDNRYATDNEETHSTDWYVYRNFPMNAPGLFENSTEIEDISQSWFDSRSAKPGNHEHIGECNGLCYVCYARIDHDYQWRTLFDQNGLDTGHEQYCTRCGIAKPDSQEPHHYTYTYVDNEKCHKACECGLNFDVPHLHDDWFSAYNTEKAKSEEASICSNCNSYLTLITRDHNLVVDNYYDLNGYQLPPEQYWKVCQDGGHVTHKCTNDCGYQELEGTKVNAGHIDYNIDYFCDRCDAILLASPVLSAEPAGPDSIKLSWKPVNGAKGYAPCRLNTDSGTWDPMCFMDNPEVINGTISCIDSGLTYGRQYYYKVLAYITDNDDHKIYSDYSNQVTAISALSVPSGLAVELVSRNSVDLSWNQVPGAEKYYIYRDVNAYGTYSTQIGTVSQSLNLSYRDDSNLTAGVTYYYKVRARTDTFDQTTGYSDYVWATIDPDFTYKPNSDGTVTIVDYSGNNLNVAIPSVLDGKIVTAIGEDAFAYCSAESIIIPDSVTSIGAGAFHDTSALTSITIPDGVTKIGGAAFSWSGITSIKLSRNLTEIGTNVFQSSKLESVVIPDSVTSIGWGAFSDCHNLSKITLSKKLNDIGYEAFARTAALKSISIPNSVKSIGDFSFRGSGITSIKLSNKLTAIGKGVFSSSALKSIVLPKSITRIGDHAFIDCYDLSSVTYSNNITHIGDHAFMSCGSLKDLLINNKRAIPKSISYIGMYAFAECTRLQSININPSSSECIIGDWAFFGCTGLTSAVIKNVNSVGGYVFWDCGKLRQAEFKNVGSIGTFAFYGCGSLKEVSISNAGTVGSFAFNNCGSLKEISISNTGLIDTQAFAGCGNMVSAKVGAKEIGSWAFSACQRLKDLKLVGTEKIGDGAFIDCSSITKVNLPKGTETIGIMAFLNCSSIKTVSLPNTLTVIGINAFSACTKLKSIVIPGSVTSLGVFAFAGCSSMTKAVIPGSVTEVSPGAFADCSSLKTVQLGDGIQSILEHAFAGCSALTNINRPGTLTFIDETAFVGAGTSLSLPDPAE